MTYDIESSHGNKAQASKLRNEILLFLKMQPYHVHVYIYTCMMILTTVAMQLAGVCEWMRPSVAVDF